jgi:hypothetical protein
MQRQLLLRPDKDTNQMVAYCLGVAAQRYQIELHGVMVMSNTLVINYRDVNGTDPAFRQLLFSLLARSMNVVRVRWEAFWSSDEPSVMTLVDGGAQLDMLIYNLTDSVRQGLVDKVMSWPGLCSLRYQLAGKEMKVKRPKKFFHAASKLPAEISLRFVPPPAFAHLSDAEWTALLRQRVSAVETKAAEQRRAEGRGIAGRKAVLRKSPYSYPKTVPPRRNPNPRVACKDKDRRRAAIEAMKHFQQAYRAASERYREAVAERREEIHEVLFPWGTWQLVRLGLVRCMPAPS